jgi:hypothetical protein
MTRRCRPRSFRTRRQSACGSSWCATCCRTPRGSTKIVARDFDPHARWIAGYILARKLTTISDRDVYRTYRDLRDDPDARGDAMLALAMLGWVSPSDPGNGKAPKVWIVNPRVHELFGRRAELEKARREQARRSIAEAMREVRRAGLLREQSQ